MTRITPKLGAMLGLAGTLLGAAQAQTAPRAVSQNLLVVDLSVASDYRYDGLSNSDRHEALQGSLYLWRPDKLYAGVSVMGVDNGASFEVDVYGGRHFDFGKTRLTLEAMATVFPDQKAGPVPTYDFLQTKAMLRRKFGDLTLRTSAAWTPEASAGAGETWRFTLEGEYPLARWLTAGGKVGVREAEFGRDRTFFDAGATAYWKDFSFDLRYVGTDLSRNECFFTDWCEPGVVSKLTWHVPNGFPRR